MYGREPFRTPDGLPFLVGKLESHAACGYFVPSISRRKSDTMNFKSNYTELSFGYGLPPLGGRFPDRRIMFLFLKVTNWLVSVCYETAPQTKVANLAGQYGLSSLNEGPGPASG